MSLASSCRFLVVAAALAVGALAPSPSIAIAGERPFKAALTGNANLSPPDESGIQRNDETGEGKATHLGRFTFASVEFVDINNFPPQVAVEATFTMTAANGDQLSGEYTTTGIANEDGNLDIVGVFRFTGGTGRFADATGGGQLTATAFFAPGLPFEGKFRGTIDY